MAWWRDAVEVYVVVRAWGTRFFLHRRSPPPVRRLSRVLVLVCEEVTAFHSGRCAACVTVQTMRFTRALIDLAALRQNVAVAKQLAPKSKCMAIVKANAYGHGATTVARAIQPDVDAMGVACISEALELRDAGIECPILLLEGFFTADEIQIAAANNFWVTVENEFHVKSLENADIQEAVKVWLKVDTGMHRLGVQPEDVHNVFNRLQECKNVVDVGDGGIVLMTHFARADELSTDMTRRQLNCFMEACTGLPGSRSASNSAGVLAWPDAHFDWIRPGYMLYGNSPFVDDDVDSAKALKPVMTLKSSVISLRTVPPGDTVGYGGAWTASKPTRIATVSIGYGDGYPRLAGVGTPVLVNGERAYMAGRVSMDMITVDVTHIQHVEIGAEVVLWGPDLLVGEVASYVQTIGYELMTRMPARTPRIVTDDDNTSGSS